MFELFAKVIEANDSSLIELAELAGLNVEDVLRGADLDGVDLRNLDLSACDLESTKFDGLIANSSTTLPSDISQDAKRRFFESASQSILEHVFNNPTQGVVNRYWFDEAVRFFHLYSVPGLISFIKDVAARLGGSEKAINAYCRKITNKKYEFVSDEYVRLVRHIFSEEKMGGKLLLRSNEADIFPAPSHSSYWNPKYTNLQEDILDRVWNVLDHEVTWHVESEGSLDAKDFFFDVVLPTYPKCFLEIRMNVRNVRGKTEVSGTSNVFRMDFPPKPNNRSFLIEVLGDVPVERLPDAMMNEPKYDYKSYTAMPLESLTVQVR